MAAERYKMDVRPEVLLIEQVLQPLEDGGLRIPRFQRPFVWRPEQILDLFDSIERGYPIGSLLFWETDRRIRSLDQIGDLPIPAHAEGRRVSYVLDGHQRLSALYATLRRPADAPRTDEQRDWQWWPYRVLGESATGGNPYVHWRQAGPPPLHYLPMRAVLRTTDFLRFSRGLAKEAPSDADAERLITEAEIVAQRIMSYKVAVVRLVGGELDDAVEVFSRVNSTGQPMRPAQMVSALTFDESGQETLAERIEDMISRVADTGFGDVSSDAVFRAVLAITGEENVQEARWAVLAKRIRDKTQEAVGAAEEALTKAVAFLREDLGVPLARLIPYDAQLMLLMSFFHFGPGNPDSAQVAELRRWFWETSWTGHFAGANSTQIRQSLVEMKAFARRESGLSRSERRARPFPDRFDLRSARVRAYLLWELREFPHRVDPEGRKVQASELLTESPTTAYRQVVMRTGLALASSPANRLIMPTKPRVSVRAALLDLGEKRDEVLASHGIPADAVQALAESDEEGFVKARIAYLSARERQFMGSFGVVDAPVEPGETDIDTA